MDSLVETIHDDLIAQLKTITVSNGYRNDLGNRVEKIAQDLSAVVDFPSLVVIPIGENITVVDSPYTVFQSTIGFTIIGFVASEIAANRSGAFTTAMESLIHDCKTVLASLGISNLNSKSYYVSFLKEHGGVRVLRYFDVQQTKGIFTIDFPVVIQKTTTDFT